MKHLITILALIACISTANAQEKIPPMPYEVVLFETIEKYCTENSAVFAKWSRTYLEKVKAEKGEIYPRSGSIFSSSNREQQRANQIAFYASVRLGNGDSLLSLTDSYAVFEIGKSSTKK